MSRSTLLTTAQGWSRILGALSAVPVIFWIIQNRELTLQANARAQEGGFVCGIGAVMLLFACMACAGILSLPAVAPGSFSYFRVPKPRPARRRIELAVVGHFFILAACAWVFLLAGKALT